MDVDVEVGCTGQWLVVRSLWAAEFPRFISRRPDARASALLPAVCLDHLG